MLPSYEDVARVIDLADQGMRQQQIAESLGKPRSTVRDWMTWYRSGTIERAANGIMFRGALLASNVEPMRQSVPKEELEAFRLAAGVVESDRAPVESEWNTDHSIKDQWTKAEEENARHVEKAGKLGRFTATFGSDPIAVAFASDQHIAPGTPVDLRQMRLDAELIAETPGLYVLLGGDGVDNHIKHRGAVMAARSQPGDQWNLFDYYLKIFAPKILVMVSGNHCNWTNQFAGIDMCARLGADNRICYAPDEARINVKMTGIEYKLALRHQYRLNSSFNQTHAVKQWLRCGPEEFDVGCVCHHHEVALEHGLVNGKERVFLRPGAYQITSAHSREYGYDRAKPRCPTVVLYPNERRLIPFVSVRDAAKWMRIELGK